MSKKYIREVKKTQNKNIQTHTKKDNTKNLHDLAFDLHPENFNNKYEQMKNGVECRGILTKIQIKPNGQTLATKLVVT